MVPVVAVNVAVVEPAGIATEAGSESSALLVERAAESAVSEAWFIVTVQTVEVPLVNSAGAQERSVGCAGAISVSGIAREVPLNVAVTTTATLEVNVPAVATKLALLAPWAMVTDAGTVRATELLESDMAAPPVPATCESVSVQLVVPATLRMLAVQVTELKIAAPATCEDCTAPIEGEELRDVPQMSIAGAPVTVPAPMAGEPACRLKLNAAELL